MSNLDMNTGVSPLHFANSVLRGAAICAGVAAGVAIITAAALAASTRMSEVEAVAVWCNASKACVSMPTIWRSTNLSVHEHKLREASVLVNGIEQTTSTPLVRFPKIEVVAVPRTAQKDQQRHKGRPATVGGTAK